MSIFMVKMTQGDSRLGSGSLDYVARRRGTISAATNASPIVVTSATHGLVTGATVTIAGVTGNTAANTALGIGAPWTVTVIDANTFSLNNSTGNGGYVSGGIWSETSVQRTMYAPGAKLTNRVLRDGQVFEDCNYWKQFSVENGAPISSAFIEVLVDDGIPYVARQTSFQTVVYTLSVLQGSGFSSNVANILNDYGVAADSVSVTVVGDDVVMRINGSSSSDLTVLNGSTVNDIKSVNLLNFSNLVSGGGTATVTVLATIPVNCRS